MMRICHVTDFLPGLHRIAGGAEYAVQRLVDEQIGMNLDVHVVTATREVAGKRPPGNSDFEMRRLDAAAPRLCYAIKSLYFPFDPLAGHGLARALKSIRPDVVHFHNLHFATPSIIRRAKRMGLPTFMTIYDYWTLCPSFMLLTSRGELCERGHGSHCVDCVGARRLRLLKPLKKLLFGLRKPLFEKALATVDHLVALSHASKDLLVRHGVPAEKVHVVPQYIWKEAASRPLSGRVVQGRLVYVGWVEARKGLHVAVQALSMLAARYPQLHLSVLGPPAAQEYQATVEGMIARAGIADRVAFVGSVPRERLLQALDDAFLVLIPEQWSNMSPVVLTEAMSAGKCVLASRVGGIPEFVEDFRSGLLAERDRPDDFAAKIAWAMEHADEVAAIGKAARERAKLAFDPASINRRWLDLYRSAVSGAGGVAVAGSTS
jgi:glycosyltransferase involved in cell wall biosynthesis